MCVWKVKNKRKRDRGWPIFFLKVVSWYGYDKPKKLCCTCTATFHSMFECWANQVFLLFLLKSFMSQRLSFKNKYFIFCNNSKASFVDLKMPTKLEWSSKLERSWGVNIFLLLIKWVNFLSSYHDWKRAGTKSPKTLYKLFVILLQIHLLAKNRFKMSIPCLCPWKRTFELTRQVDFRVKSYVWVDSMQWNFNWQRFESDFQF